MAPLPPEAPLGLYVHVPFCAHICPYCDFNTYAGQDRLIPRYVAALERDVARQGAALGGRGAATLFFGGGTPSLLPSDQIGRVIRACRDAFDVLPDAEVTLEANPTSVDEPYFAGLRAAGVNRLSLGVQTVDHRGLRTLGRNHEAADAEAAFAAARAAGFANISLDLIFGWPGQTLATWQRDLDTVLAWQGTGPEHLSLYSLIVEPGTPLADAVKRGILTVPDDDAAADLYEAAIACLERAGFVHYEVANWARGERRPGGEAARRPGGQGTRRPGGEETTGTTRYAARGALWATQGLPALGSRHNAIYWRNGDYLGFGAGAHGHVAGRRVMNHLLPKTYIAAIEAGEPPVSNVEEISPATAMGETMMLGLRLLLEGVTDPEFTTRHGISLEQAYGEIMPDLVEKGLLVRTATGVHLTHRGLMLANDVCARFL